MILLTKPTIIKLDNPDKKNLRQFGRVYSIVSQMFLTIAVGILVGYILDLFFHTSIPWITMLSSFVFFALAIYNMYIQINKKQHE